MEEKQIFHERYYLEHLLGRGNFSEVWLAQDKLTNIQVALKIYAPATGLDDAGLNMFAREFALVVNANHKNLLKPLFYASCERKPYLVLPYCEKGSILKDVGTFTEQDAWRLLRDVSSGLAALHGMKPTVIHQDIKPDNIMLGNNGDFMITDFGVSTHLRSALRKSLSSAFSSAGTMAYMAPERFSKDNTPIMASDIYSLGATAYEMLTGDPPFGEDGGLMQKKGAEIPELKGPYSDQLKKTIGKCLKGNSWERPTAEQLEKYAITALEGKPIHFLDEKTVWQKFRWAIIAAIAVVLIGGVFGTIKFKESKAKEEMLRYVADIKSQNDSILNVITLRLTEAVDCVKEGDVHDEYYENSYIDALVKYKEALETCDALIGVNPYPDKKTIEGYVLDTETKLYKAYIEISDKSKIFEDDPEIFEEFEARALHIKSHIDVAKYETEALEALSNAGAE